MIEPRPPFRIPLRDGRVLDLSGPTKVMAIVNVTPDSFADGGERFDPAVAIADALQMVADGADILDIGGESTRPGAPPLPEAEELGRVVPVLEGLRGRVEVPISIDTYKAAVAERAIALGELGGHFSGDIRVLRFRVHLTRSSAIVHEDQRRAAARDDVRERRLVDERADVVDDRRAEVDGAVGNRRFVGVNRDRHAEPAHALEHRRDATPLLRVRQRPGPGPRRLAADVEDVGAVGDHPGRVGNRDVRIESLTAVGERIGRDVDDRHHERTLAESERTAVDEWNAGVDASGDQQLFLRDGLAERRHERPLVGLAARRVVRGGRRRRRHELFERQTLREAEDLVRVEDFPSQQLVGDAQQNRFLLGEDRTRARVLIHHELLHFLVDALRRVFAVVLGLRDLAAEEDLLFLLAERERAHVLAHAPFADHLAREFRDALEVVAGAGRQVPVRDLLGDAAAEQNRELILEVQPRVVVLVVHRQLHRHAERHAARDDRDLVHRIGVGQQHREKRVTAYHEAGHTLVGLKVPNADPVHKVTIIPRGMALGVTQQLPEGDRHNYSQEYLLGQIAILMGGRIAEESFLGSITTGASNDIERATELARAMVCEYGMSEMGPLTFGKKEEQIFLGREIAQHRDFSEDTAIKIDQEVKKIVTAQYERAKAIIEENRETMIRLAECLLERESLDGVEIRRIVAGLPLDENPPAVDSGNDQDRPQLKEPTAKPLKPILPPITGGNPQPA